MKQRLHRTYIFPKLNREKTLTIYGEEGKQYTTVVYFHDDQNLWAPGEGFGGSSWQLLELGDTPFFKDILFVGIPNGGEERMDEYGPYLLDEAYRSKVLEHRKGGKGTLYIEDLVHTILPKIESEFTISSPSRALVGSSMGGLISLYAGLQYPEVFPLLGCFSNAFWFSKDPILKKVIETKDLPERIYMSTGTAEAHGKITDNDYLNPNEEIFQALYGRTNVLFEVVREGIHNESVWSEKVELVLRWLLQKKG